MRLRILAIMLTCGYLLIGCGSSNEEEVNRLNSQLDEASKTMNDTIDVFNDSISNLLFTIDSLETLLNPPKPDAKTSSAKPSTPKPKPSTTTTTTKPDGKPGAPGVTKGSKGGAAEKGAPAVTKGSKGGAVEKGAPKVTKGAKGGKVGG